MQPTNDQKQYLLTDPQNQLLFSDIWLDTKVDSTHVTNPTALFLGGQPGSGKSSLAQFHLQQFADRGGVVLVNSDALQEYHPAFADLQRTDADQASFLVNPDTVIWQQKLISAAIKTRRNLLLDGTLGGNLAPILATMQRLRSEGYSIQVSVLAVPAEQSRLGIYKRYEDQLALKGSGRWVGMETHNRVYEEIPKNLALFQQQQLIDEVTVFTRPVGNQPPGLIYEDKLINGTWESEPKAGQALEAHRNRLLTYAEYKAHKIEVKDVQWQLEQTTFDLKKSREFLAHVGQTAIQHRLATAADVQLYFDWANDPTTRHQSFNSEPISWEKHVAWFTRKVTDRCALLLVFETNANVPIGQVRFERFDEDRTEDVDNGYTGTSSETIDLSLDKAISISVDARFRGKGIASMLIEEACEFIRKRESAIHIVAYIKPDNVASVRAFERAGFAKQHSSQPDRLRLVKG